MAKNEKHQEALELRHYAEKQLAERPLLPHAEEVDNRRLFHELQVHQIELEIQNEQLRQVQIDLEASLTRFTDLYEFAPVGYMTLTAAGFVDESNHTAAAMLGVDWARLLRRRFDPFIAQEDISRWYTFFAGMLLKPNGQKANIRVSLCEPGQAAMLAQLNCVHVKTEAGESKVRIALTELNTSS